MANALNFGNNYFARLNSLINNLEELRLLNDRATQDSSLITNYFEDPSARTDIVEADFTNMKAAVVQLLFTYDSGSPTQKSRLFKAL